MRRWACHPTGVIRKLRSDIVDLAQVLAFVVVVGAVLAGGGHVVRVWWSSLTYQREHQAEMSAEDQAEMRVMWGELHARWIQQDI